MSLRLRLILPAVMALVTCILVFSNSLRPNPMADPAWRRPDIQWCASINAPAAVVLSLLDRAGRRIAPESAAVVLGAWCVFFLFVLLIWYAVGCEIDHHHRCRGSALIQQSRYRPAVDVVLLALGALTLWFGFGVRRQFGFPIETYANLLSVPYFVWAVVIMTFYGRDLYFSLLEGRQRRVLK